MPLLILRFHQGKHHSLTSFKKNHLLTARPKKGSWVQEESPDFEAVHPTTSNPPPPFHCTCVYRFLLLLFSPERLLGLLWKPWLWRRFRLVHILCPCTRIDSVFHIHALLSVCELQEDLWSPSVAQTHRSRSLYMTLCSYEVSQSGPYWVQRRLQTPISRPLSCRVG